MEQARSDEPQQSATDSAKVTQAPDLSDSTFRILADHAPALLMITDCDGTIVYVNAAFEEQTGYPAREVVGQKASILKSGQHSDAFYEEIWHTISRGGVWSGRITNRMKDGSLDSREVQIWGLRDASGGQTGYVSSARPAARDPHIESQWIHSQKMEAIGELASGIAHEINTPTQYIGDNIRFFQESFTDLTDLLAEYDALLDEAKENDATADHCNKIAKLRDRIDIGYILEEVPAAIEQSLEGNRRVAEIVRAMKEFAHPGDEVHTPVNLERAIQSAVSVARNEWKYVADVETQFDSELKEVPCLPGAFNQVVLNLIVNAAHAIESANAQRGVEKGRITIRTQRSGDWAEIRIADTGTGIPESIQSKVFDPFFTTKGVGKGTGQGLASAHYIIAEKHGGTIHFESVEGAGTTFVIRLPLSASNA